MIPDQLLAVLQLADGLFPAGGFAHSFGLETYVQTGHVRDRAGLEAFLCAQLEGVSGPADAVAVAWATRWAAADDLAACFDLDARLDAMKWVLELRAASLQMGHQTMRAVAAALAGDAFLARLAGAVEAGRTPGHHPVVVGAALGRQAVSAESAAAAYLWSTAMLVVSAGLRLIAIGQIEGQVTLTAARPLIARLATEAAAASVDALWSFTPGLELAGVRHAELEMRLFRS
jgi:urease accessory protein